VSVSTFKCQVERIESYYGILTSAARLNVYERAAMIITIDMAKREISAIERTMATLVWC
jgi:hypothetical protein